MAANASRPRTPADRRGVRVAVGVALLAVTSVVLSVMALTQFPASSEGSPSSPTPLMGSPTPDSTPVESATPSSVQRVVPVPDRLLGAVTENLAYRSDAGGCPQPRALSAVSNDGGLSWAATDVSGITGSSAALTYAGFEGTFVSMVTLTSESCEPQYVRSFVSGTNWEVSNDDLSIVWYFDPRSPTVVHTPEGDRPTPCTAVSLAASGTRAAVLCADERVFATSDGGATWPLSTSVPGASAIAVALDGYDVAVLNQPGCAGVQIQPLTPELVAGSLGSCLEAPAAEGSTAVSTGIDGVLWIWAGEVLAKSADRGATWL